MNSLSGLLQVSINARTGFERVLTLLDTRPKIEMAPRRKGRTGEGIAMHVLRATGDPWRCGSPPRARVPGRNIIA